MSGLKINIDVSGLAAQFKELAVEAEQAFMEGVKSLAAQTHAHVAEEASRKLKGSLQTFKENLGFEEVIPGVWAVSINEDALWIEEGIPKGFDMKPGILNGKGAKTGPGGKYAVVPFDPSRKGTENTGQEVAPSRPQQNQAMIAQDLKQGLKQINKQGKKDFKSGTDGNKYQNITVSGIEKNKDGSPRIGKLHEFDMDSIHPTGNAKHPALKGVTIYQSKDDKGNVRRDVLTFRTVSANSDPDSWKHPGYTGKKFLDEAEEWAKNQWENQILPDILKGLGE